jgi:hypothetical protein
MTNDTHKKLIEEILAEFDKRFGVAGPEKNCDSVGRRAGCDDCSENIEVREEHRHFLSSSLQKAYEQGQSDLVGEIEGMKKDVPEDANTIKDAIKGGQAMGWNLALVTLQERIRSNKE